MEEEEEEEKEEDKQPALLDDLVHTKDCADLKTKPHKIGSDLKYRFYSLFLAETVLQRLESLVFRHHRPKFWARYVDDTFVVIERDQVLMFKEHLNAIFPDIQFTMEKEEGNTQLACLDVLVCRKDCGGLKTKVFRKVTNTTQILNFNSNHPISHKRSCVRALYQRVETHCSEMEDKVAELQYLRRVMRPNGYPRNTVNQCMQKRHQRPNSTGPKFWRALPYVKNVS
ncbi:hypothetical protein SprV_0401439000 [Sparganum proliferum]